jgi:PhnB protein
LAEPVQVVTPHLIVNDGAAALEFYKKGLGASETLRMPAQDGKRLMHAEINLNGARIFVMDDFPEMHGQHGELNWTTPKTLGGTPVTIHIEVANCDEAVKRMADAGATVTMPPWDAFWGARYGQVLDPFGHSWSFAHPLPAKG